MFRLRVGTRGKIRFRSGLALFALSLSALDCAVYDGTLLANGQGNSGGDAGGDALPDQSGAGGALSAAGANSDAGTGNVSMGTAGDDSPSVGSGGAGGNAGNAGAAHGGMPSGGHAGTGGASGGAGGGSAGGAGGAGEAGGTAGSGGAAAGGASAGGAGAGGAGAGGAAAGNGGSGGAVGVLCADHPFTSKSTWVATASSQSTTPPNPSSKLTDGTSARWSSGKPQAGDEWIQVDFGSTVGIRSINLQQGSDTNDYPRQYAVILSSSSKDLTGTVLASGLGVTGVTTTITLPKVVAGRYLLIKQLGSSLSWWSVAEVEPACIDN